MAVWICLIAGGAAAAPQATVTASDATLSIASTTVVTGAADAAAPQQQQPPPPPPPPPRPSTDRGYRRGSMVGYIYDATVGSRVRLRIDSARENTRPDRAEFFYAKCGCFGGDAAGPPLGAANDLDFQQVNIWAEYAFGNRVSVFGHLPFRWIQPASFMTGSGPGFGNEAGVSDVRAGAKLALLATDTQSLTVRGEVFFPSGDAAKGLGTDHASVEPALLHRVLVADAVSVESMIGVWLPAAGSSGLDDEDFSGRVLTYGIGGGVEVYRTDRVRLGPVVEVVGWRVLSGAVSGGPPPEVLDASDTNIVNVKIGGRATFNDQHSFYVGYGRALTDETWYEDILRVEYRFSLF
jgi:hypothetical protein